MDLGLTNRMAGTELRACLNWIRVTVTLAKSEAKTVYQEEVKEVVWGPESGDLRIKGALSGKGRWSNIIDVKEAHSSRMETGKSRRVGMRSAIRKGIEQQEPKAESWSDLGVSNACMISTKKVSKQGVGREMSIRRKRTERG